MNKMLLVGGLAVAAANSHAIFVIDPTPGSLAGTENVLFYEVGLIATGSLVQGVLNDSRALVDFYGAGENLTTPPGGQARVTAVDGSFTMLTTAMTDPGLGIAAYQFDVNAKTNGNLTIDLYVGNSIAATGTFAISTSGSNWFRIYGTQGEVMTKVSMTSTGQISDVRQNRIGAAPAPVPEPSAIVGLGIGLTMLLRRRFKK
jgi:hypothetical protein